MAWHGHLARDFLRHFRGYYTFFTGKMPVPRLKASISQPPYSKHSPKRP